MKPATRLVEITPGLHGWSSFHTEWKVPFDSYAVISTDGVIFIDPMMPSPPVLKKLKTLGAPLAVFLTNAHHDRDADWFRKTFDIQIYAHEKAQADCATKIDVLVMDGEKLPGGLRAVHMPGSSSSETAYHTKQSGGLLLIGDTLLNVRGNGLSLLAESYCEDRRQARQSLKKLLPLSFKVVTFAHGEPIVEAAKGRIASFIKKPK